MDRQLQFSGSRSPGNGDNAVQHLTQSAKLVFVEVFGEEGYLMCPKMFENILGENYSARRSRE